MDRQITLNEELTLSWPKGFFEMTKEELEQAYRGDDSEHWALQNKDRHVIIMVMWKKYSPLAIRLTGPKKMLKKNEKLTRAMCRNVNYHLEFFFTHVVAGTVCGGFCYTYRIQDIRQAVKTVLLRKENCIYSISCYGRAENAAADHKLFDMILKSVSF